MRTRAGRGRPPPDATQNANRKRGQGKPLKGIHTQNVWITLIKFLKIKDFYGFTKFPERSAICLVQPVATAEPLFETQIKLSPACSKTIKSKT